MRKLAFNLVSFTVFAACRSVPEHSNIILFLVDDMGWIDSGAYGSRYYETTQIDRLAAEGMRFTDAYSASPMCSPTRASILTGRYPARLGITHAVGAFPPLARGASRYEAHAPPTTKVITPKSRRFLPLEERTIAEALRAAGYRTAHLGKWHLGLNREHWPDRQGFDVYLHASPDAAPPAISRHTGFATVP